MVNGFLQYLQYEKNYSSHTVLSYTTDLKQFLDFLSIDKAAFNPDDVNPSMIQQWIIELMQAKTSARTISRKVSTLKSFWHYLQKKHKVSVNPTLKIVLPKTKKPLPVFFKDREIMQVLDNPFLPDDFERARDLLILEMFYMTGIRLSELIAIEDKDVDFASGALRVIGKRNKQRIIPIDPSFCQHITNYMKLRDDLVEQSTFKLFVRSNGKSMYPKLVYNIVHNMMSQVSTLPRISPHVMRHSFATELLNGGADINALKELLGHSSLAATQVYTHTGFGELNNIYKRAHPRAK
ncbi:MAG: tyrosine-type recombinase/integrase [Paludibacter sp.]|nr:tyrosine-type recombinase/integrase [Paludibacter sp.]